MFTPPNENLIWSVHRFRSSFVDSIGNVRTGMGTGFWLSGPGGQRNFITNKHNVDLSLKSGASASWRLTTAEIELRRWDDNGATASTSFFTVADLGCITSSPVADCSVLISPTLFDHSDADFPIADLTKFRDVATAAEFQAPGRISFMDPAVFIGFPGAKGQNWYDEVWKLPVARECIVAAWPGIPFTNSQIATEDVLLVSGLSFAGASGSPVFVQNRGLRPGGAIHDPGWRPARLIGIMSDHFWDEGGAPPMFAHSGLSYLTRSGSIIDTLRKAGAWRTASET